MKLTRASLYSRQQRKKKTSKTSTIPEIEEDSKGKMFLRNKNHEFRQIINVVELQKFKNILKISSIDDLNEEIQQKREEINTTKKYLEEEEILQAKDDKNIENREKANILNTFFSEKWINNEKNLINRFNKLAETIDGFAEEEEIPLSSDTFTDNEGDKTIINVTSPKIDKEKFEKTMKKIIPKYGDDLLYSLNKAIKQQSESKFDQKNLKDQLEFLLSDFSEYYTYLLKFYTFYHDILERIISFRNRMTIQLMLKQIYEGFNSIEKMRDIFDLSASEKRAVYKDFKKSI